MSHFQIKCAIGVFLLKNGQIYLMRRAHTGWNDGAYGLPAGHVEEGESVTQAALREVEEETGLVLKPEALVLKHASYRRKRENGEAYADYYFVCESFEGTPVIKEPHKCDGDMWAPENALPTPMVPEIAFAWQQIRAGQPFSDIHVNDIYK